MDYISSIFKKILILKAFILPICITFFLFGKTLSPVKGGKKNYEKIFFSRIIFSIASLFILPFSRVFMTRTSLFGGVLEVNSHYNPFMCKQIKKLYLLLNNIQLHLLLLDKIILLPLKSQICRIGFRYIAKSNVNNIATWNLMNLERKYSI
jgi:hypothetical protein